MNGVQFVKIANPEPVVRHLVGIIRQHVEAGDKVLWLISGGSVIPIASAAAAQIAALKETAHITVAPTDERPGPIGHVDSNWQALLDADFRLPGATLYPILTGATAAEEATSFGHFLQSQFDHRVFTVALAGMGADGHTLGIPHAGTRSTKALAAYYQAPGFERISMTAKAMRHVSECVVYCVGPAKKEAITRLARDEDVSAQSAQALKLAFRTTVYNDLIGDSK